MPAKRALLLFIVGVVLGAASLSRSSPDCPMLQGFGMTIVTVKKNGAGLGTNAPTQGYVVSTSPDNKPTDIVANVLDPDTNAGRPLSLVQLQ